MKNARSLFGQRLLPKLALTRRDLGLLSESKQHALEQETDDRIQKIENPGIATFKI